MIEKSAKALLKVIPKFNDEDLNRLRSAIAGVGSGNKDVDRVKARIDVVLAERYEFSSQ